MCSIQQCLYVLLVSVMGRTAAELLGRLWTAYRRAAASCSESQAFRSPTSPHSPLYHPNPTFKIEFRGYTQSNSIHPKAIFCRAGRPGLRATPPRQKGAQWARPHRNQLHPRVVRYRRRVSSESVCTYCCSAGQCVHHHKIRAGGRAGAVVIPTKTRASAPPPAVRPVSLSHKRQHAPGSVLHSSSCVGRWGPRSRRLPAPAQPKEPIRAAAGARGRGSSREAQQPST